MKYSPVGDRLWVTSFSSSNSVLTFGMDADYAGNTTIHGKFTSNLTVDGVTITTPSSTDEHGFVAQLNPAGDLNWIRKIIPGSNSYFAKYLEVDDSGNVLFENYNTSTINGITNNGFYTLTKLDQNGNVLWRYNTSINTGGMYNDNLIAEFNGGYVIAGSISDTTTIAGVTIYPVIDTIIDQWNDTMIFPRPETLLIFLDVNGNEIDFRTIQGSGYHYLSSLYATDSILYVSGQVYGFVTNGTQTVNTTSVKNFLTAYDLTLNPLFITTSIPFEIRGLYSNQSHIYTVGINWESDGYMEKFDTHGIIQDTITIVSSNTDYIQDIRGFDNGKVVIVGNSSAQVNVCGFTMSPESGFGSYVLKLDGEILWQEELEITSQNILVYPNPTNSNLTIITPFDSGTIELMTLDGKTLVDIDTDKILSTNLDCSKYNSGLYILKITDNLTKSYCRRIFIE
ncbi:MAG: T9SS type A sorting domain-containing protein [Flavobacteriia bacterium]|nr:T9SS type A sorting domain-containing protein [Flavobacteriia bacterium]